MITKEQILSAEPRQKKYKLSCGEGLYVMVMPSGSKYWQYKYRFNGKANAVSFGVFPAVSMDDARGRCEEAKKMLSDKIDPNSKRKIFTVKQAMDAAEKLRLFFSHYGDEKTIPVIDAVVSALDDIPMDSVDF